MKENTSGAETPPNVYVYSYNDLMCRQGLAPLLIDRLGRPGDGGENRLILALPLLDSIETPTSSPNLWPVGLPLFDWAAPSFSTKNEVGSPALVEGGHNAVRH